MNTVVQDDASNPSIVDDEVLHALARRSLGVDTEFVKALGIAPTDKELVHASGPIRLYRYKRSTPAVHPLPLLFVMSLINRYYIVDLARGRSLVEYLLSVGYDVYLIDWGRPRAAHSRQGLEHYVQQAIPECMERVLEDSGESKLTMVSYCLGGLLALLYAALHPRGPLKNLVCLATPVNGEGMTNLRAWCSRSDFDVATLIDGSGNVPPEKVLIAMQLLRPLQQTASEVTLLGHVGDRARTTDQLRLAYWVGDQVPFPGTAMRELVQGLLRDNDAMGQGMKVGRRRARLDAIKVPVLHVAAEHDHIVPLASCSDLVGHVGSKDKQQIVVKGGHVSLVAGRNAQRRLWPELHKWLEPRSQRRSH